MIDFKDHIKFMLFMLAAALNLISAKVKVGFLLFIVCLVLPITSFNVIAVGGLAMRSREII